MGAPFNWSNGQHIMSVEYIEVSSLGGKTLGGRDHGISWGLELLTPDF